MESMDKSFKQSLERAIREVKYLSLPGNSFVDAVQFPLIRRIEAKVHLGKHFLANINHKHLKHSRELMLRKNCATI